MEAGGINETKIYGHKILQNVRTLMLYFDTFTNCFSIRHHDVPIMMSHALVQFGFYFYMM